MRTLASSVCANSWSTPLTDLTVGAFYGLPTSQRAAGALRLCRFPQQRRASNGLPRSSAAGRSTIAGATNAAAFTTAAHDERVAIKLTGQQHSGGEKPAAPRPWSPPCPLCHTRFSTAFQREIEKDIGEKLDIADPASAATGRAGARTIARMNSISTGTWCRAGVLAAHAANAKGTAPMNARVHGDDVRLAPLLHRHLHRLADESTMHRT